MKIKNAIKILRDHNTWRRGNDENINMTNPTKLGIAIDTILDHLTK